MLVPPYLHAMAAEQSKQLPGQVLAVTDALVMFLQTLCPPDVLISDAELEVSSTAQCRK